MLKILDHESQNVNQTWYHAHLVQSFNAFRRGHKPLNQLHESLDYVESKLILTFRPELTFDILDEAILNYILAAKRNFDFRAAVH